MTDPRIAAFARTASGNVEPVRIIEGQKSGLTRVAHGITYDPARDEIWASEPLASSVVCFRGDANGQAAPLRMIQGAKTKLHGPMGLVVDDKHHELVVADDVTALILVYPWDANGNVAPLRVIGGPRAGMRGVSGVAVDPVHNLIVAASGSRRPEGSNQVGPVPASFLAHVRSGGLFIFNRTDNGDVAPRAVIAGPHTGIGRVSQVAVYDDRIYTVVSLGSQYRPPYDRGGYRPRPGCTGPPLPLLTVGERMNFVGVWNVTDSDDVPPRAIIFGPATELAGAIGIALNPQAGEIYVSSGVLNGAYSFLVPQFF